MKKVQILMTTYNGERYLRTQIDSILEQDYPNIQLLIRDDGSSDSTLKILEEYSASNDKVSYYTGVNLGVVNSNFDLIKRADTTADYYSFADQDDYWMPNKISQAVLALEKLDKNQALLYCGRPTLADKDLKILDVKINTPDIRPCFNNALVENICTGCTAVINNTMLVLVKEHIPEYVIMHDWWFYLLATYFGQVYYDKESYILYRQHSDNVMGARTNYWNEFLTRLQNYKGNRGKIRKQLAELQKVFNGEINNTESLKELINSHQNLVSRLNLIRSHEVFRQRKMDDIIFKILILIGQL
jgi:glycosyltransferase involved in cell wall biosynthesis